MIYIPIHESLFRSSYDCQLTSYDITKDDIANFIDILKMLKTLVYKVPHKCFIAKLESHGMSGNISNKVEDWLSNRKQRFRI